MTGYKKIKEAIQEVKDNVFIYSPREKNKYIDALVRRKKRIQNKINHLEDLREKNIEYKVDAYNNLEKNIKESRKSILTNTEKKKVLQKVHNERIKYNTRCKSIVYYNKELKLLEIKIQKIKDAIIFFRKTKTNIFISQNNITYYKELILDQIELLGDYTLKNGYGGEDSELDNIKDVCWNLYEFMHTSGKDGYFYMT